MTHRTRADAIRAYVRVTQQALDCITPAVLSMRSPSQGGTLRLGEYQSLYLNNNHPVLLSANVPVALVVAQRIQVLRSGGPERRQWTVIIQGYNYVLRLPDNSEIVAYQWDPEGPGRVNFPHLHIGRGATGSVTTFGPRGLHRIHFPTKHIELEDVLRLAISEFGVEPRRDDWERVLGERPA